MEKKSNRGWHGSPEGHTEAGRKGGMVTARKYGREFFEAIGKKGGLNSRGKFIKGDPRTVEAGRKGGKVRHAPTEPAV